MHPICLDALSPEQLSELDQLYHTSPGPRVRVRSLMILLSAERHLVAAEIAAIVRQHEETVRRWLALYEAEGIIGLADALRSGTRPRPHPLTEPVCWSLCADAHAPWVCHSRSEPRLGWPTTWPRRLA